MNAPWAKPGNVCPKQALLTCTGTLWRRPESWSYNATKMWRVLKKPLYNVSCAFSFPWETFSAQVDCWVQLFGWRMGSPGTLLQRGGNPPGAVGQLLSVGLYCVGPPQLPWPGCPFALETVASLISFFSHFPFCFKFLQTHLFVPGLVTNAITPIRSK